MNLKKWYLHPLMWPAPFVGVLILFLLVAIYAPLLAFGKPLLASFEGQLYFPLGRYLLYKEAFSKPIDLCFNALMLFSPGLFWFIFKRATKHSWVTVGIFWIICCGLSLQGIVKDPATSSSRTQSISSLKPSTSLSWEKELLTLNGYARFNLIFERVRLQNDHNQMKSHLKQMALTPWEIELKRFQDQIKTLKQDDPYRSYLEQRWSWIDEHIKDLKWQVSPLLRPFFWEENTGKDQSMNPNLPWYQRARANRKDLVSSLIYGTRVSFVVGVLTVGLALSIGIPLGAISAYFAGRFDIIMMRFIEIWESFPTFFMLLFITTVLQSKAILLVIIILGFFNWTGFARYVRAEVLRQKQMPYTQACQSQGLSIRWILFSQILPNAISPVLTLLPFAVMNAISSEAGLSFLGLGEEGSCSWGNLMNEGRLSFPAESYLLWPPALALSALLVAIAIVGDWIHDQLDPKRRV